MKLKLPSPNLSAPKMPSFLGDLFQDLRDRRLLPLAAVLVVGIAVVPFALAKSDSSELPPADSPAASASAASPDSELAVVEADPGLRDYRKRLEGSPKDPFVQQFPAPSGTEEGGGDGAPDLSGGGAETGTDLGGGDSGDSGGDVSEPPLNDGTTDQPGEPSEPEPAFVVTVRTVMGEDVQVRELNAGEATELPGPENPLLTFRGLNDKGNAAIFRVGEDVQAIFGDAECLEGTDRCELVEIEPGLPVDFVYGDPERIYRLTVVDIEHNR